MLPTHRRHVLATVRKIMRDLHFGHLLTFSDKRKSDRRAKFYCLQRNGFPIDKAGTETLMLALRTAVPTLVRKYQITIHTDWRGVYSLVFIFPN